MKLTETEVIARFQAAQRPGPRTLDCDRLAEAGSRRRGLSLRRRRYRPDAPALRPLLRMDLRDEEMAMVLSLMDQLHSTRSLLRAMTVAVHSQPNEIREAILTRVRLHLAPSNPDRN